MQLYVKTLSGEIYMIDVSVPDKTVILNSLCSRYPEIFPRHLTVLSLLEEMSEEKEEKEEEKKEDKWLSLQEGDMVLALILPGKINPGVTFLRKETSTWFFNERYQELHPVVLTCVFQLDMENVTESEEYAYHNKHNYLYISYLPDISGFFICTSESPNRPYLDIFLEFAHEMFESHYIRDIHKYLSKKEIYIGEEEPFLLSESAQKIILDDVFLQIRTYRSYPFVTPTTTFIKKDITYISHDTSFNCFCGSSVRKDHIAAHLKTAKHKKYTDQHPELLRRIKV